LAKVRANYAIKKEKSKILDIIPTSGDPLPPTKLGSSYVHRGPNKLVGTHIIHYQIGWLEQPTLLAPCWHNVPTLVLFKIFCDGFPYVIKPYFG
jgi:hypothetical protein